MLHAGQAVSNVFDGNRELDGSLLKGITRRCRLGVLTLFEVGQPGPSSLLLQRQRQCCMQKLRPGSNSGPLLPELAEENRSCSILTYTPLGAKAGTLPLEPAA